MQVVDKYGNTFGQGHLIITSKSGKSKLPVVTVAWGNITGALIDQTDLQDALNLKVPTARTITINGVAQDLSADRTWTISTGITVNTTPITGGVSGRLLFDNAGTVGETSGINWNSSTATLSLLDSPFYSQAGNSSTNTAFSITGTASSNYTIYSSRQFIFNTGQSMYFNTDTDGGSALDRAWYFAGARSGLTGGRTYGALTVDSSGFPSFTLYNNDNGARILLASNATSYFNGGNLLVGTTTDAGFKLYVNGTSRVNEIEVNSGVANTRARLTDSALQFSRLSDGGYTPSISRLQSSGGLLFEGYDGGHKFVRGATVLAYINVTNPNYSGSGYLGVTNISTTSIQTAGNDTLYLISDAASGSNDGIVFDRGTRSVTAVHSITTWKAAGVEKGRFTQGGSLLINTTTDAGYKLDVAGTGRFSNTLTIQTTATGGSPSNSILISTNETGNGGRISWGDSNTSILRYSNSLYFREYTGNFVFESTGANAIYFSIRPWGTTLSAGPFTTNSSITAASSIARGVYFNNTLTQSVANDVLTAVQITPTLSVNNTLFHEVYWLRLTGSYTPASFTGNNNATTIDLSNSFTNTNNAIGIRIRHTYSNVQNGYGLLIESGGFIGIAQTSTTSRNFFAGTTVIGSSTQPAAGYTLHVTNNTNGAIKIGGVDQASEHLIISHSQAQATFSSIRNTFASAGSQMLIDVAGQGNLRLWGTGNVIVGGTTDAGYKLDVNGTSIFRNELNVFKTLTSTGVLASFSGYQAPYQHEAYIEVGMRQLDSGIPVGISILGGSNIQGTRGGFLESRRDRRAISFNDLGIVSIATTQITSSQYSALTVGAAAISIGSLTPNKTGVQLAVLPREILQTGNLTLQSEVAFNSFGISSLRANIYATTYTNAYNVYIDGEPTAGSAVTFTNKYSLYVNSGKTYLGGNTLIGTAVDAGYKLDVNGTARVSGTGNVFTINETSNSRNFTFNPSYATNIYGGFINHSTGHITLGANLGTDNNSTVGVFLGGPSGNRNASALFQMDSTNRGFLPPRMSNAQMLAIGTPAEGLMVYDTTNRKLCCYDGATWQNLF